MNNKTRIIEPIGWSLQNPFPATVTIGTDYEAVYQLVSNLPAPMPAPLTVTYTGGSDFTVVDQCSGLFLVPGQTCNVTVRFTPSSAGVQQFQLTLHYFNDVVPLPVQTMTAEGSTTLIVGSVTQALPATTVVNLSILSFSPFKMWAEMQQPILIYNAIIQQISQKKITPVQRL
ncbi:hypothetical protein [Rickettsiella endosymbiont of Xylota segnis]|uniref:hypothetical protein n=1 Tax=Rickettsiella endosymbiont of Xylota segnis TaxID=3066238 RepID=UPI0030D3B04B